MKLSAYSIFSAFAFLFRDCSGLPENQYILETDALPLYDNGTQEIDPRLLPTIGNGHLATNAFSDALHVNGLFNGLLGESHRARIRSRHAMDFDVDGCDAPDRTYRLDMQQGLVEEEISCESGSVSLRTYAHASLDRLMVTEVHVSKAQADVNLTVRRRDLSGGDDDGDIAWGNTNYDGVAYSRQGQTLVAETEAMSETPVFLFWNGDADDVYTLGGGVDTADFVFVLAVDTGTDGDARAYQDYQAAMSLLSEDGTGDGLRSSHLENWGQTWASGKLELEGDDVETGLKETIAASLYYIYSSLPSLTSVAEDPYGATFSGIAPGGLARGQLGQDYNGHIFWDQETWMMPPIAMFRPDLAKIMLNYRLKRIEEARSRAADGGYNGARFPWESAVSGAEVTPYNCPLCAENEQHITGDISWASRFYLGITRDIDWLTNLQPGFEITGNNFILEMARFWESRPTFSDEKQLWEINDVMPPDENQEHANNSVFTNMVANLAVNTARWTTCLAFDQPTAESEVPDEWLDKMYNLVFLYNEEKQYHEEFEGFDEQYTTGTLDERGIKIADVVLLGYPMLWDMPNEVRQNDLDLYESITPPDGPAMTWSMYTISWIDLQNEERAEELFFRSYQLYVREPFNVWTEKQTSVGAVNFITGGGGFLQTIMFGYVGMRVYPYYLEFRGSYLPPGSNAVNLTGMHYLGASFDLRVEATVVTFTCYEDGELPLVLEYSGGLTINLACNGNPQTVPRTGGFKLQATTHSDCVLPPDDINVNYEV